MAAAILDGRALATRIEAELCAEVETYASMFGRRPRLVVVLVGDAAASASYVKGKAAAAARVGIDSDVVGVPGAVRKERRLDAALSSPSGGASNEWNS